MRGPRSRPRPARSGETALPYAFEPSLGHRAIRKSSGAHRRAPFFPSRISHPRPTARLPPPPLPPPRLGLLQGFRQLLCLLGELLGRILLGRVGCLQPLNRRLEFRAPRLQLALLLLRGLLADLQGLHPGLRLL